MMNLSAEGNFSDFNGLQGEIINFMKKSHTKLEESLNDDDK